MRVQVLQEELETKRIETPIRAVEVCAVQAAKLEARSPESSPASRAEMQKQAAMNRGEIVLLKRIILVVLITSVL